MYITQEIANRIRLSLKPQHKTAKDMLSSLKLGINTISEFSKGKELSCISLARIADYLNVSVDYLLGRTDRSELLTSDEAQLLEAYNSSPYVKNAIDGLLGIGNVKQIPINRDDTLKTYAVALGGQTKQGEITQAEEEKISRLAQIVEERQKAEKDKKE